MSYLFGKPLDWASCLRRNNSKLMDNYEEFIKALKKNFGDYTCEAAVANSKLCSLHQRRLGHVYEYISEFERIAQYSNFNENAKIHMFIQGLKQPLRERLAMVDPNPTSLMDLTSTILNIENLTKRNDRIEYYNKSNDQPVPMDIDVYRIRRGPSDSKYTSRMKLYKEGRFYRRKEKRFMFPL